jgi:hypothetical protein
MEICLLYYSTCIHVCILNLNLILSQWEAVIKLYHIITDSFNSSHIQPVSQWWTHDMGLLCTEVWQLHTHLFTIININLFQSKCVCFSEVLQRWVTHIKIKLFLYVGIHCHSQLYFMQRNISATYKYTNPAW